MEFVIVTCDNQQRTVFIDNQEQGVTDSRLSVPEGLHVFDLGAPVDYEPPFLEVLVENTTHLDPMPIPFSVIPTRETVRRERVAKRASRTRKHPKTAAARRQASGKKKTASKPARARRSTKRSAAKGKNKKR